MHDSKRVLVVEDNPALASVVRYNLDKAGLLVEVARNGREAWDRLQENRFDCVVSDYQMPEMDGHELCKRIRQSPALASIPVLLLTAKELELDVWQVIHELGVVRVWPKPFSPVELCNAVIEILTPVEAGP